MRVHYDVSTSPGFTLAACGPRRKEVAKELGLITCRTCRRRAEEDYASQRDGFSYRHQRYQAERDLVADRQRARMIVAKRHQDEVDVEFALLRLARMGANLPPDRVHPALPSQA